MKILETLEEKENPLLMRKEVKLILESEKNPSISEAVKILAEKFGGSEENIVVERVKGKFGMRTFLVVAKIYKSKEDKERIEPKRKEKKEEESKQSETSAPVKEENQEVKEETKETKEKAEEKKE